MLYHTTPYLDYITAFVSDWLLYPWRLAIWTLFMVMTGLVDYYLIWS